MSEVVPYYECAEWLQDNYPDHAIIRVWNNGDIEFAMNNAQMDDKEFSLKVEDLPGDWTIENVMWGSGGVSFILTRSINLSSPPTNYNQ